MPKALDPRFRAGERIGDALTRRCATKDQLKEADGDDLLNLRNRNGPATMLVAEKFIELAKHGFATANES